MGGRGSASPAAHSKSYVISREKSLTWWTEKGYKAIRRGQMGKAVDQKAKDAAEQLEKLVSGKSVKGEIYRGIQVSEKVLKSYKVGNEIGEGALSSWTTSAKSAKAFGMPTGGRRSVIFSVRNPQNTTDISKYSKYSAESEVLMSGSNRYRIRKISTWGGSKFIELEPVRKRGK